MPGDIQALLPREDGFFRFLDAHAATPIKAAETVFYWLGGSFLN